MEQRIYEAIRQLDQVRTDLAEHLKPKRITPYLETLNFEVERFLVRSKTINFHFPYRTGYIQYSELSRPSLAVVLMDRKKTLFDVDIYNQEIMLAVIAKIHLLTSPAKFKRFIKLVNCVAEEKLPVSVIYALDKKVSVKQWNVK